MTDRTPAGDRRDAEGPLPGDPAYDDSTAAGRAYDERPAADRHPGEAVYDRDSGGAAVPVDRTHTLRNDVVERERSEFGGMKFGSAFFGWLTATGTAVLLTALLAAAGAAVGLGVTGNTEEAVDQATRNASIIGIVGAIVLVVILFVSYFCGGYVAGRMARFDGAKQGLAVWLWAVVIAVIVAVLSAVLGSQYNILGNLNSFPRIPLNEGDVTLTGIITAIAVAVVSLAGAVVGGLAGMRYHRRVDRAGLGR